MNKTLPIFWFSSYMGLNKQRKQFQIQLLKLKYLNGSFKKSLFIKLLKFGEPYTGIS